MTLYNQNAGRLLRRFRQQRQLKLRQVAPLFHRSIAALSRAERGEEEIERNDIRHAVEVFHLSDWEANELWLAAGLVPEEPTPLHEADFFTSLEPLLAALTLPAFIIDAAGYLQIWNQAFAALWSLEPASTPPHLLDHLFSKTMRINLGTEWAAYTQQWITFFQRKLLSHTHEPALQRLLADLATARGREFSALWDTTQPLDRPFAATHPQESAAMVVRHPGAKGEREYLVTQAVTLVAGGCELILYAPVGMASEQSLE